ncbi:hypothetical protein PSP20601_04916 [Pandoraea sputorum]|nr:hypothetical protein PSP20601_04916 [Pandoraea sputorum]
MRDEIRLAKLGAADEATPAQKAAGKEAAKAIEVVSDLIDEVPDSVGELIATKRPVDNLNDPVQEWRDSDSWLYSTGMMRKLVRYPLNHPSNGVEISTRRRDQVLFNRLA